MQQLTFKNALADAVNFAKNVQLPFDNSTKSSPENAVCRVLFIISSMVDSLTSL
jgi:hypothetical protein